METKSRYEVIAELESQKMKLIFEKNNLDETLKSKKRRLRDLERDVEDRKEDIKEFKEKMEDHKKTNEELIKSIDESLARFTELAKK